MRNKVDLLIVGAGSAGLSAARVAKDAGKSVLLVEDRAVGGTCPHWGCIPSKFLIEAARQYHAASHPTYAGLPAASGPVQLVDLLKAKDQVLAERQRSYEKRRKQFPIDMGKAEFVDDHTVEVSDEDGSRQHVRGERILLATGAHSSVPEVEGLKAVPYFTSDWLGLNGWTGWTAVPPRLLVLGGGYIALELGQLFARLGSRVTLLERGKQLLASGYEPEVGPVLTEALHAEAMSVEVEAHVERVHAEGGTVKASGHAGGAARQWTADRLLVATGRTPNTRSLRLEAAGIKTDEHGGVVVDEQLRTTASHVYAAGDVIGRQQHSQMATPVANDEGVIAANNALALGPLRTLDLRIVPRAIFSDPEVASVGLTEKQARQQHGRCVVVKADLAEVPRAELAHARRGFVKLVAAAEGHRLLGATIVGREAGEMIHTVAIAMRLGGSLDDLAAMLYVFPSLSECLKVAAKKAK